MTTITDTKAPTKSTILFDNDEYLTMHTDGYFFELLGAHLNKLGYEAKFLVDNGSKSSLDIKSGELNFYFQPVSHCGLQIYYDLTGNSRTPEYTKVRNEIKKFNLLKNKQLAEISKNYRPLYKEIRGYNGKFITEFNDVHFMFTATEDNVTMVASTTTDFLKDQLSYKFYQNNIFSFMTPTNGHLLETMTKFVYNSSVKNGLNNALNTFI